MERLRTPFLLLAILLLLLAVLVEIGASLVVRPPAVADVPQDALTEAVARYAPGVEQEDLDEALEEGGSEETPPGLGVPDLALLDALLLFSVALMGAALVIPERVQGRLQGAATLVVAIIVILLAILLALKAFALLIVMVTLFLAVPFGTIAYLIVWGFFDTDGARAALALALGLKLAFAACLLLAHQRFLKMKSLVLLVATSLATSLVVSFLHGLVPGVLVSITDAIAAIVVCIVAVIWAIVLIIGSIPAIVRAVTAQPGC